MENKISKRDDILFFDLKDDFMTIIKNTLNNQNVVIDKISTGWTNFVFKVSDNNQSYIFRFPRNNFFAKTLIKEELFNNFVRKKVSFKIPKIKLHYIDNKPFTEHNFINGQTLTEVHHKLNNKQIKILARDISKFIKQLQSIDAEKLNLGSLSEFLEGLSKVGQNDYDLTQHNDLINLELKSKKLSHADFNPGNIILNNKFRLIAVIDFAFVSHTYDIVDITRLTGRLPDHYSEIFINEYEKRLKTKVNKDEVNELVKMWQYVEKKYIEYMKQYHIDVILPNL